VGHPRLAHPLGDRAAHGHCLAAAPRKSGVVGHDLALETPYIRIDIIHRSPQPAPASLVHL
jgi:hypothetical protein